MLCCKVFRLYHPMKFPWRFDNLNPFSLFPVSELTNKELLKLEGTFIESYKSLMVALQKKQLETIENFSTDTLYKAIHEAFLIADNRKHRLTLVNQEEIDDIDVRFFNEKLTVFMPKIFISPADSVINFTGMLNQKNEKFFARTMKYKVELKESENFEFVFKVDAIFTSACKLAMVDANEKIIRGSTSDSPEMHLVQYSATSSAPEGDWSENTKSFFILADFLEFLRKNFKLDQKDWLISDIDDYLKNNS